MFRNLSSIKTHPKTTFASQSSERLLFFGGTYLEESTSKNHQSTMHIVCIKTDDMSWSFFFKYKLFLVIFENTNNINIGLISFFHFKNDEKNRHKNAEQRMLGKFDIIQINDEVFKKPKSLYLFFFYYFPNNY